MGLFYKALLKGVHDRVCDVAYAYRLGASDDGLKESMSDDGFKESMTHVRERRVRKSEASDKSDRDESERCESFRGDKTFQKEKRHREAT